MELTIALLVYLIEFPTYLYITISAFNRYLKYHYSPDLFLSLSFFFGLIPSNLRFWMTLLTSTSTVLKLFRVLNTILMIQIFLVFISFSLYYINKYDMIVILFGFATGILTGAFIYSSTYHVIYDQETSTWNAVYPSSLFFIIIPLTFISFIRIIQPLIRKVKSLKDKNEKSLMFMMTIGVSLILLWGVLTLFTSNLIIRNMRPVIFAIGWLIWFLASQRNPFFLSISNSTPIAVFITNKTGHVYASYEFKEALNYEAELVVPLLQAINSMASEIFKDQKGIVTFNIGEYDGLKIHKQEYDFYLITLDYDDSIKALFNYFVENIVPVISNLKGYETMDIKQDIQEIFSKLQFLPRPRVTSK